MSLKPCRFLDGTHCAYQDDTLLNDEDIKCYEGGWDCFETPGDGIVYENRKWLTFQEYADWVIEDRTKRLPEGYEYTIPDVANVQYSERMCPACQAQVLKYVEGQLTIVCTCGAVFELNS